MPPSGNTDKLEGLLKVLDKIVENLQKKFAESEKRLAGVVDKKIPESEKRLADLERRCNGIEKIMEISVEGKELKAVEKAAKDINTQMKLLASLTQLSEIERRIKALESRK